MAQAFLTEDNFKELWTASEKYMDDLRRPYDEWERVKNNRPHPKIDPNYPQTTDGTTAAQVRVVPRRSVQQVPYGSVRVGGDEALEDLANFLLTEEIIPNSDTQDGVLGKSWKAIEDQLTYGHVDSFIFYKADNGYFGTDWRVPYVKDVYLEAGKGSYSECNVVFVKTWYQRTDIQKIIDKEESLASNARKRGEKYSSPWDLKKLKEMIADKKSGGEKENDEKTDAERERNIRTEGFEVIHGFQKGKKAYFYSYTDVEDLGCIKKLKNPDPRGVIPIERMYYECDYSNPEGRGIVELVAPLQNFLDSSLQSYQFIRALLYAPPLLKKGSFNKSQIQYRPNAIIDLGSDPNSKLEALSVNNPAITNFAQDYGLIKSQILNLFGSDDQSISAEVGNPGFSKTDAGVNARQALIAVNDNFVRKRYEDWISRIFCTQLNLYFQLTQGDRKFPLKEEDVEKLSVHQSPYFEIVENELIVHFSLIQDKEIEFEAEASTSKSQDNNETKEKMMEAVETLTKTGLIQYTNPQEITKRLLIQIGVEDPEKLMMQDPMMGGEMGADPADQQVLQNLINAGYPPEIAQQALMLEKQGYAPEQIDQILAQQGGR
jgi:hypothetical protein